MIRTVADLRRALEAFPDDMQIRVYSRNFDEYRTPVLVDDVGICSIEPRHVRSDITGMSREERSRAMWGDDAA